MENNKLILTEDGDYRLIGASATGNVYIHSNGNWGGGELTIGYLNSKEVFIPYTRPVGGAYTIGNTFTTDKNFTETIICGYSGGIHLRLVGSTNPEFEVIAGDIK